MKLRRRIGSMFLTGLVLVPDPAGIFAQDAYLILEEVIVTARKRKESLQDTPVAVSAFNARALQQLGVNNLQDLDGFVPGLQLTAGTGTAKTAQAFMRGVGRREAKTGVDAAILTYVDGIYQWRPEAALMDTLDVDSIEVLRGPQGTLFGKNTTAGAILVNSKKPSAEPYSKVRLKLGNYDRLDVRLIGNGSLSDNVFAKVNVSSIHRSGFVKNTRTGRKLDDEDRLQGTLQLRWMLDDDKTWDVSVGASKRRESARVGSCRFAGYEFLQADPLKGILAATDYENQCKAAAALDAQEVTIDYEPIFEVDSKHFTSNYLWDIGDFVGLSDTSLKSTTGWVAVDATYVDGDQDGTALTILHTVNRQMFESNQYTQELQFNGTARDGSLRLVSGLFATYEKLTDDQFTTLITDTSYLPLDSDIRNWSYALFSQASYDLGANWELSGGLRYTVEERSIEGHAELVFSGIELPSLDDAKKTRYESFTPMVNLRWNASDWVADSEWLDSLMAYATYSEGYKAGGFSLFGTSSIDAFDPEDVQTFELGLKLDGLDNHLRLNLAAFYADYSDMQLLVFELPPGGFITSTVTRNAGQSTTQGFEAELSYLPWHTLMFMGSLAYTDARYDKFMGNRTIDGVITPVDRSVEDFTQTPQWTAFFAVQYVVKTVSGSWTPRFEASYKDDVAYHMDHGTWLSGIGNQDSVTLLNASLSWEDNDRRTSLRFYGRNITNEEYADGLAGTVDAIGAIVLIDAAPAVWGVELSRQFGGQ